MGESPPVSESQSPRWSVSLGNLPPFCFSRGSCRVWTPGPPVLSQGLGFYHCKFKAKAGHLGEVPGFVFVLSWLHREVSCRGPHARAPHYTRRTTSISTSVSLGKGRTLFKFLLKHLWIHPGSDISCGDMTGRREVMSFVHISRGCHGLSHSFFLIWSLLQIFFSSF